MSINCLVSNQENVLCNNYKVNKFNWLPTFLNFAFIVISVVSHLEETQLNESANAIEANAIVHQAATSPQIEKLFFIHSRNRS